MGNGAQGRSEIVELLRRHGVKPSKRLGQNFLIDPNIIRKIVDLASVGPGAQVLEVGSGTGTLTRELGLTGAEVVGYELDDRLEPVLAEVLAGLENVEWHIADAAEAVLGPGRWTVVANLPYYLSTTLLLDWLQGGDQPERFVVMVQREVADRIVAPPGSRVYGLPTVITRLHGEAQLAFRVPPSVFYPQPDVESAVVEIKRHHPSSLAPRAIELAGVAFGQRRKMMRRSLADKLADPEAALDAAGIDPTSRPEDLGVDRFLALAEVAGG